jgi:hypothetical protein
VARQGVSRSSLLLAVAGCARAHLRAAPDTAQTLFPHALCITPTFRYKAIALPFTAC